MPAAARRKLLRIVAPILGFLLLSVGSYWLLIGRFHESTDNAYVQSDISFISPKVEGYVSNVLVTDNQSVKAGDVLVEIDKRDFQDRLTQAQANLDAAQAEQQRAQNDLTRFSGLVKKDFVSRQQYEQITADANKANAAVEQAKAALALAQSALDYATIHAPIDGVVGNRGVRVGQYVSPGTQLMAIVPLDQVYIVANFKETQLGRMQPGQPVDIEVDAYPGKPITGTVASFSPASGAEFSLLPPENATGNFTKVVQRIPVRINLPADNPLAGKLRPGLSVVVNVNTRHQADSALPVANAQNN